MLSDSLELMHFLRHHGQDKNLIQPAIEMLDEFTDKWHRRASLLRKDSVNVEDLKLAVEKALDEKPTFIQFQSRRSIAVDPGQPRGPKMVQQERFYGVAYAGNLARMLRRCARHQPMYGRVRNLMLQHVDTEEGPRTLRHLVHLSLGTRTLQPQLDEIFGNSISRLVKNDFTELWFCRFGYVLLGLFADAECFDPLIRFCRTTPVLGRLEEKPHTWLFWED